MHTGTQRKIVSRTAVNHICIFRRICYSIDMKAKIKKQKMKVRKKHTERKQKNGPFAIFLLTFSLVVSVGILGLLVSHALSGKEADKNTIKEGLGSEPDGSRSFWESIPEGKEEIAETMAGIDKEPPEANVPSRYGDVLADEAYMKENRILAWEAGSSDEVTIGFAGDILMDDEYAIMAKFLSRGGKIENGISPALLEKMRGADIMVVNNEFPYTNRGTPTEGKTFTFRADVDTVGYLHDMGADVAVLANNHIYDFGETGLLDTLDTLEAAGIPGIGAGRNLKEASAPLYFIVNDMKIAIVAATQIERLEPPDTRGATENGAGVFRCLDPARLYETVKMAKENSDFVIVYIHWGTENQAQPDWRQLEQAPGLAQAGADLIIGDHPHCLQGITYCGEVPVIYSLGNFWFNSKTMDTGMVQVTIGQDGLRAFQFIPAIQSGCQVDMAFGEEKERILAYMRDLSPGVAIDGEGFVSRQ